MDTLNKATEFVNYLSIKKRRQKTITLVVSFAFIILLASLLFLLFQLLDTQKENVALQTILAKERAEKALLIAESRIDSLAKISIQNAKLSESEVTTVRDSLAVYKMAVTNNTSVNLQNDVKAELIEMNVPLVYIQYMPSEEYKIRCKRISERLKQTRNYRIQKWEQVVQFSFNNSIRYNPSTDSKYIDEVYDIMRNELRISNIEKIPLPKAKSNSIEIWIGNEEKNTDNANMVVGNYLNKRDSILIERKVMFEYNQINRAHK